LSAGPSEMYFQPPAGSGSSTLFQAGAGTGATTAAATGAGATLVLVLGAAFAALIHGTALAALGADEGRLVVREFGLPAIDAGGQVVAPTAP
jgi:hypothetical protein